MRFGSERTPPFAAITVATAAALWLVFLTIRAVFGKRCHSPYRAALATLLPPVFALGALLTVALIPLTHHSERYWLARDELTKTSSENLGMGSLEAEAARVVRSKIQDALQATP